MKGEDWLDDFTDDIPRMLSKKQERESDTIVYIGFIIQFLIYGILASIPFW